MRRVVDVLLVAAILGAAVFGVSKLGHKVDTTSSSLASHDSELVQPAARHASHRNLSHHTIELLVLGAVGALSVVVLVSVSGAAARRRRRQRWRAT
ncbi:MAG TPA: hypothetical protein VGC78_10990 [Gaiellaceae bacterium]|jgi:hypothetical protein